MVHIRKRCLKRVIRGREEESSPSSLQREQPVTCRTACGGREHEISRHWNKVPCKSGEISALERHLSLFIHYYIPSFLYLFPHFFMHTFNKYSSNAYSTFVFLSAFMGCKQQKPGLALSVRWVALRRMLQNQSWWVTGGASLGGKTVVHWWAGISRNHGDLL